MSINKRRKDTERGHLNVYVVWYGGLGLGVSGVFVVLARKNRQHPKTDASNGLCLLLLESSRYGCWVMWFLHFPSTISFHCLHRHIMVT